MNAELWLALAVVFAGLWSGLLLTLTTILHRLYAAVDGTGFRTDMGRFLPVARRSPTNYVVVLGLLAAPTGALIGLRDQVSSAAFILTAVGLAFTVVGPLLTSRYLAEPNYDVILSWDPVKVPDDWQAVRARYFALNWIRGAFTWAAFGLFVAALVHGP